ncbi:hypothetical protein FRC03_008181 [Tulasnella sp. 419]|nr:hypothetical protein FRC03_008181 [Tulasnella sp. 419]
MSHPTLWDTVSEEVGQNFRFEASIDTCKELEITSDDERLVTFYGFHCGQRGPTTCHIRACKKRDFKQVLTSFLEGPLAPYNFSGLRSLTFCGTRYTKPMPSVYATFLYDLHALETLALVGLFAAADTIVHCLISHVSGYSESGGAEVCCPRLEGLELIFSHVRTDFFLALVEHRVNNMSLKRLRMVHSDGLASIDTVLLIEQFIGRENFDWDGYAHLDEDWGSEGSMSEASTTDEEDIDGTYSMNIDEESNGMSISDDEESSDEEASSGMSISDEEESESTDQDDVLAEGGSQYSDWDADNEDTLSLWSRDSDGDRMPRWHSLAQS